MYTILDRYPSRKTKGVLETEKTLDGKIVVFKNTKTYDDDDNLTITKTAVLTTTAGELQARLLVLQAEKQNINAFMTAENIV
jgi:hypothetical protein